MLAAITALATVGAGATQKPLPTWAAKCQTAQCEHARAAASTPSNGKYHRRPYYTPSTNCSSSVFSAELLDDGGWEFGGAPPILPHCREVIIVHVPKTGGVALMQTLDGVNGVSLCQSGTGADARGIRVCGPCEPMRRGNVTSVGVHEQRFGPPEQQRRSTLYVGFVREPRSWYVSALMQACGIAHRRDSDLTRLAQCVHERGGNSEQLKLTSFSWRHLCAMAHLDLPFERSLVQLYNPLSKYYYHTADLQSTMLGGLMSAENFVLCTEMEPMLAFLGPQLGVAGVTLKNQEVHTHSNKSGFYRRFNSSLNFSRVAHLYQRDLELYRLVSRSTDSCIWRLTSPRWVQRVPRKVPGQNWSQLQDVPDLSPTEPLERRDPRCSLRGA